MNLLDAVLIRFYENFYVTEKYGNDLYMKDGTEVMHGKKEIIGMVYHYCSLETFLNIIRSHTLRLSDLCNSTDKLEMKALLDILESKVKMIYKSRKDEDFNDSVIYGMELDDAFLFLLQSEINKIKNESNQLLYGICFSEEGDLLGQWREYADKGRGISIGFDKAWFENLCTQYDLFKFSKVIYVNDKTEQLPDIEQYADDLYTGILEALVFFNTKNILSSTYNASYKIVLSKNSLLQNSIFMKTDEYKNEKEWRLILDDDQTEKSYDEWSVYYNWKDDPEEEKSTDKIKKLIPNAMEFMVKNNKIISYLDLKFDFYKDNLPVKKIIIGPNCKVSNLDIFHLLEFYGFEGNEIEIIKSESSYRI